MIWAGTYNSNYLLTSSKLFKHQVEFVFLFKELHQLKDITKKGEKGKKSEAMETDHRTFYTIK